MSNQRDLCHGDIARVTPVMPWWLNFRTASDWVMIAATLEEDDQLALGLFGPGSDEPLTVRHDIFPRTQTVLDEAIHDILQQGTDAQGRALEADPVRWAIVDPVLDAKALHAQLMAGRRSQHACLSTFSAPHDEGVMHTEVVIYAQGDGYYKSRFYNCAPNGIVLTRETQASLKQAGAAIDNCLALDNRCTPFVAHHPVSDYLRAIPRCDLLTVSGSGLLDF